MDLSDVFAEDALLDLAIGALCVLHGPLEWMPGRDPSPGVLEDLSSYFLRVAKEPSTAERFLTILGTRLSNRIVELQEAERRAREKHAQDRVLDGCTPSYGPFALNDRAPAGGA